MSRETSPGYVAFLGTRRIAAGPLDAVAAAAKTAEDRGESALVFDNATGRVVDLDLRGRLDEVLARLDEVLARRDADPSARLVDDPAPPPRRRGRPSLGVVSREISLLPRHWEWLNAQGRSASATLRRLIDEARKAEGGETARRAARDAAYRFMSTMAGDLPGFEEATRALFADDLDAFRARIADWPEDIGRHALELLGESAPDADDQA